MSFCDPSKSAIKPWLDFNGTLPFLGPCTDYEERATSCSQVCNDSYNIFQPLCSTPTNNNLAICGIWVARLVEYIDYYGLTSLTFNGSTDINWTSLTPSAFNLTSFELVQDTANLISTAFEKMYVDLVGADSQSSNLVPQACEVQTLFPYAANVYGLTGLELRKTMADSLKSCVSQICSPATLNADLAGIGVRTDLIHLNEGPAILLRFRLTNSLLVRSSLHS